MAEYIEREAVIHRIRKVATMIGFENPAVAIDSAITVIERAPTADVAPVRHGKWNADETCSFCGEKSTEGLDAEKWNYWFPAFCPHCGAKMDLEG